MSKTPGRLLSPLIESYGSVTGDVLDHLMDASTVEMPSPPPILRLLPLTLPPLLLTPIPYPHTPSPQIFSPGLRPNTRSHSTSEKSGFHGRKWFEDYYGVKKNINVPHPFLQWFLSTTIGSQLTPG